MVWVSCYALITMWPFVYVWTWGISSDSTVVWNPSSPLNTAKLGIWKRKKQEPVEDSPEGVVWSSCVMTQRSSPPYSIRSDIMSMEHWKAL